MLEFLSFIIACVHGILLFHVLRLIFLERRQKKIFVGREADIQLLNAWQQTHQWDLLPGLIAGLCGVGDALLMMMLFSAGPVLAFFSMLYGFIGLLFLAYVTLRLQRPIAEKDRSPTAKKDILELRKGVVEDLYGTWLVRGEKEWDHDYVKRVEAISLDPAGRRLSVRVKLENWDESIVAERSRLFRFHNEVLEFLIYLITAEWFGPYVPFFEVVDLELVRDLQDEGGRFSTIPFYRITAQKERIQRARDKGCDPFHLERHFGVVFKGGAAV